MSKIIEISDKIKAKLELIDSIEIVEDTMEARTEWFPCVQFEPSSMTNIVGDSCNNLREIKFTAVLLQTIDWISTETWQSERKAALLRIENVYWEIVDAFDSDIDLTGSCEWWVTPTSAIFGEANIDTWNLLFVRFEVNCKYLFNIK